jgi:hypothetical protein
MLKKQFQLVTQQSLGFGKPKKFFSRKHGFMFCPPLKRAFNFLGINLITSKNQHFPSDKFYYWLVLGVCSKISRSESTSIVWYAQPISDFTIGCNNDNILKAWGIIITYHIIQQCSPFFHIQEKKILNKGF